MEQFDIIGFY